MTDRVRQFTYISKTKVAMLDSQMKRRIPLRDASAKIIVPGAEFSISGGGSSDQGTDLVARAVAVERKMRRRKQVKTLTNDVELSPSSYYADRSTWWHGLFAFKGDFSLDEGEGRVVSYVLWRAWNKSIILLAGSPENVLGERVARDGIWAYGTSGTWASILRFVETTFDKNEPDFQAVTGVGASDPGEVFEVAPLGLFDAPRGIALAVLCAGYLSRLPQNAIETVFSVSQRLTLPPGLLPEWAAKALGDGSAGERRVALVRRCEAVYVGSPVFTAL